MALVANPDAGEISAELMECGIELGRFYAGEALRLLEAGQGDPNLILAERLLAWLHADPSREVTHLAEIYQLGPNAIRDKDTANRIVAILVDHGWLQRLKAGAEIGGRRRRDAWRIAR